MSEFENGGLAKYLAWRYECREQEGEARQFPHGNINYPVEYAAINKYFNEQVHPQVVALAAAHGDGLLNDHGASHVAMVISRASILLGKNLSKLTGYEAFILLLAIHFHDVGNVYGREGHEKRIASAISKCKLPDFLDAAVIRSVIRIAAAHGGRTMDNSKDTIAELEAEIDLSGVKIRPALLASIVRFADEIADDNTRVSAFASQTDAIPEKNAIYHRYSAVLQPVAISENDLHFQFGITLDDVAKLYDKNDTKVLLYDEILYRMRKCYCELIYCSRYAEGLLSGYRAIRVEVGVYCDDYIRAIYMESFRLKIGGYPEGELSKSLHELPGESPGCLTGDDLRRLINKEKSKNDVAK